MDLYDKEAVQAVWARVTASKEQSLEAFYARALHAGDCYRRLALRFPKYRSLFLRLARDEGRHAKQLAALYYMHFGCAVTQSAETSELPKELRKAVRECYRWETEAVQSYKAAAEQFPAQHGFFTTLADEKARHADRLLALLQTIPIR